MTTETALPLLTLIAARHLSGCAVPAHEAHAPE